MKADTKNEFLLIKKTERLKLPSKKQEEPQERIQTYTPNIGESLYTPDEIKAQKINARISLLSLNTIVGVSDKAFSVLSLKGFSGVDKPYEYVLEFISDKKLSLEDIIDTNCKFTMSDESSRLNNRTIFGQIININEVSQIAKKHIYKVKVVNPFEYLKYNNRYKIYQNMNVVDIIKETILNIKSVLNMEVVCKLDMQTLPLREYCTQYNQSDYDFIFMLAQEERFSIVFDDSNNDAYKIYLVNVNDHVKPIAETIFSNFTVLKEFASTSQESNYYDHTKPSFDYDTKAGQEVQSSKFSDNDMTTQLRSELKHESIFDRLENLNSNKSNDLTRYSNLNASSDYAASESISGSTYSLKIQDLVNVNLKEYKTQKEEKVIILNTSIDASFPNAADEYSPSDIDYKFEISFNAIPHNTLYLTKSTVSKPRISGVQTAIVAAMQSNTIEDENTIDVDHEGKIKVVFHFDRAKPVTCFIRLGTMFSGNNWGAQFLPRVNTEVIVSFINGNIDKPVIIGSLYNGNNKIPHDLPASKTKSYIKTNSMPSSSNGTNYNELLFEDKAEEELLSLRAQKDYKLHALHNSNINIDNDQDEVIGNNESVSIGNNQTTVIGNDETKSIGNDKVEVVGANESLNVALNQTQTIGGNQAQTVIMNKAETIAIAKALSIGAGYQISVGGAKNESVGSSSTEQVGSLKHIIAGERFELQVGSSSLVLNSDGTIILSGKEVTIEGSSAVTINGKSVEIN